MLRTGNIAIQLSSVLLAKATALKYPHLSAVIRLSFGPTEILYFWNKQKNIM